MEGRVGCRYWKVYPLPMEHRSWGRTHDPICLYLWYMCLSWKTLDKNTLRKTKTHHPILQTDTTNVSFRKGSTPQNKNRSYPSGMNCLKPQDAKDYIRFHQTLEYIQPHSSSINPEYSRRKTARYQVVPCHKGRLLKTDATQWTVGPLMICANDG